MNSKKISGSTRRSTVRAILNESRTAEMLTPSEIESLRQGAKETSAFARKVFAQRRATKEVKSERAQPSEMLTSEEIANLRRKAKQDDEYFKQTFSHLRPKKTKLTDGTVC